MKVVLLAGGFGSRISEESQFKPKPMIEIGGMPILWHIMKEYAKKYIENIGDVIDEFISNFGYDGIENYIKYDRLAKLIVEADGPESTIASYDGVEREETVDGQTYYIYRVN